MKFLTHLVLFTVAVILNAIDRLFRASGIPQPSYFLSVAAWTKVADLWVPSIVQEGMSEPIVERAAFLDSGVVATNSEIVAAASGPGTSITINFVIDPNHADQLQQEDTAPEMRKIAAGIQQAAIFNRVSPLGATALSGVVSGVKPNGDILATLLTMIQSLRKKQRNRLVLAQLQGLFHTASTPAANTGALKALRLDKFLEAGATPLAANLVDSEMLLDGITLAGENSEYFSGGAIVMHSDIANALNKQDQIDVIRNSEGAIVLRQWKGLTVVISDLLRRAGATDGYVYTTFICGLGSIAMGDKPQVVTDLAGEVAALQLDLRDIAKNNVAVYDRTRFILHPQGAKWTGTPADTVAGPTNAEVATVGNWALGANDVKNVRIVCVRSNG